MSEEQKTLDKNRKRVEKWLMNNQKFINITGIEKEMSAPKGLIQKFIKYDKRINDKWINALHEIIKRITSLSLR